MSIGRRPNTALTMLAAIAALAAAAPPGKGSLGAKPPEIHDPRFRGNPPRTKHGGPARAGRGRRGARRRLPSLARRLEWDRQALTGRLAVDLHPHVRRRIEFQRHVAQHFPGHMRPETRTQVLGGLSGSQP